MLSESERGEQYEHVQEEIEAAIDRAHTLERLLPNLSDPLTKGRVEQVIQSYRRDARCLSERATDTAEP
jgi:hypothetical protein